ncbi:hypothetical protein Taro_037115, partial [Colocasia esculenta]|nr:hypothetical protein [Colocasia esculenta]
AKLPIILALAWEAAPLGSSTPLKRFLLAPARENAGSFLLAAAVGTARDGRVRPAMGQNLGSLWSRIQGKQQVQRICDKVFDKYSDDTDHLALDKLHLVILLVYNYINKSFPKPHKSPPSRAEIDDVVEDIEGRTNGIKKISRAEFCELIMKWLHRDLRTYMRNKVLHVLTAAGTMAAITKRAAMPVPWLHRVVDKVPIPLLTSAYTVGFAVLDNVQVDVKL